MLQKFSSKTFWVIGLALLTSVPLGGALVAHAYTNPGKPVGFVNDFAQMLASADRQALEAKLTAFQKETTNEIAVVTIPSLEGDTVENFAVKLFEDWKIGNTDKDNGVLLLIAAKEHDIKIEVGYGLEGALTDAQSYWIIQNQIVPAFRASNYYAGINATVDEIIGATKGEFTVPNVGEATQANNAPWWLRLLFSPPGAFFLFFVITWGSSILARSKSWWMGGVVGGVIGIIVTLFTGFLFSGFVTLVILIPLGLLFDFAVSRAYEQSRKMGRRPPWWGGGGMGGFGGGGRGFGGGGFGGFGGGGSGGGGSSGKW